ncbi:MAG: oligopeptide/dipeptide ABC transporter ATP-binding protein [Planctomycetota bacterium]
MPLLEVRNLVKHFPVRGGVFNRVIARVHAVSDVSFDVEQGEIVGVVGESGCGKSTLGKVIVRLHDATAGDVVFDDHEITKLRHRQMIPLRQRMQMIFQDPYSSLNPRMTVRKALREAINLHSIVPAAEVEAYIDSLMEKVGLRADAKHKYPHEFSGGQRQRIGIARALALQPEFLVADEPVSALDVSIQAQVLNLLMDLKAEYGLTLLFISHDLKVIEHFCDRVLVMYLGKLVEEVRCDDIFNDAKHPYTQALLGANPINDPADRRPLTVLEGDVPSPFDPPPGCPFAGRCPRVQDVCHKEMPPLVQHGAQQRVACWAVEEDRDGS